MNITLPRIPVSYDRMQDVVAEHLALFETLYPDVMDGLRAVDMDIGDFFFTMLYINTVGVPEKVMESGDQESLDPIQQEDGVAPCGCETCDCVNVVECGMANCPCCDHGGGL